MTRKQVQSLPSAAAPPQRCTSPSLRVAMTEKDYLRLVPRMLAGIGFPQSEIEKCPWRENVGPRGGGEGWSREVE